jgi:hypothetical protein
MTIKALEQSIGGLSNPSKMPGWSYGIPAASCKIGAILRKIKKSVCFTCYAFKGMYVFPVVKAAQAKRLAILTDDIEQWESNMIALLIFKYRKKTGNDRVFRWHDAGDIQSVAHFQAIVNIANAIPTLLFWIPTKEYNLIRSWGSEFPSNLTVRVSAPMLGETLPSLPGTVGSTVGANKGFQCPAYTQDGECGPCRACWNKSVEWVDYPQH